MILDSFIQLLIIPIFSFFLRGRISLLYNYFYEGGLTPIVFTLLTYYYLFRRNSNRQFNFEYITNIKSKIFIYIFINIIILFYT